MSVVIIYRENGRMPETRERRPLLGILSLFPPSGAWCMSLICALAYLFTYFLFGRFFSIPLLLLLYYHQQNSDLRLQEYRGKLAKSDDVFLEKREQVGV